MITPKITPMEHHVVDGKIDPAANYSRRSLAVHWLSGLGILILAQTQLFGWTSAHTSFGLLLAIPLIARAIYRWSSGFPRAHDQHPTISLIERLIIIALLICMFTLALSGLLLPLFQGAAYSVFSLTALSAPYEGNADIADLLASLHRVSAYGLLLLFGLHLASFIRHIVSKKQPHKTRMLKSIDGGK